MAFEGAVHCDMGNIEVEDQQTAAEYFVRIGLVDPAKIGIYGWSYGGYMSAMSLCRAPLTFVCAVAGAPVTAWGAYDTHYTERYMRTPQTNSRGYESSSVMSYVAGITGRLLLVHGLIDENVHFRHTARLIDKLTECRKRYDLVLFPSERHSPHGLQDKVYLEDRLLEFFLEQLLPIPTSFTPPTLTSSPPAPSTPSSARMSPTPPTLPAPTVVCASTRLSSSGMKATVSAYSIGSSPSSPDGGGGGGGGRVRRTSRL